MLLTLAKIISKTLKSLVVYLDARISKLVDQQVESVDKNHKRAEAAVQGIRQAKAAHANKCAEAVTKLEIQRSELKALA